MSPASEARMSWACWAMSGLSAALIASRRSPAMPCCQANGVPASRAASTSSPPPVAGTGYPAYSRPPLRACANSGSARREDVRHEVVAEDRLPSHRVEILPDLMRDRRAEPVGHRELQGGGDGWPHAERDGRAEPAQEVERHVEVRLRLGDGRLRASLGGEAGDDAESGAHAAGADTALRAGEPLLGLRGQRDRKST